MGLPAGFDNHSINSPSDGVIAKNIALARNARIHAFAGMAELSPSTRLRGGKVGVGEFKKQKKPPPQPSPACYFVCHKINKRERELITRWRAMLWLDSCLRRNDGGCARE